MTTIFSTSLLTYYHTHKRGLPWRENVSAYRVWLSEMMLQQTTVATVIPYFHRFLESFPTVKDLAAADEQDILHLWQGLGYYARARNLHKCAKIIAYECDGLFPDTEAELMSLPGVGPYTAAAIAAMAFNKPTSVLDGNVERVMARLYRVTKPLPASKEVLRKKAAALICKQDPASYANAIMDLGATICTPKAPKCLICPVKEFCKSAGKQDAETFPRKTPKKKAAAKTGIAYVFLNKKGQIYLQQRPENGLLGNLWEVPSLGWENRVFEDAHRLIDTHTPCRVGAIKHVFTHFTLKLDVMRVDVAGIKVPDAGMWCDLDNLPPLPKLMQKVIECCSIKHEKTL